MQPASVPPAAPPAQRIPPWRADRLLRAWWSAWWAARLRPTDTLTLTQRNIYIVPTVAGWMYALTLIILLVASINYRLNLGFLLTFLLAGSAVVAMHMTHNTLRGLTLRLRPTDPVFAGDAAWLDIELSHARARPRHGVALATQAERHWSWTDVPESGRALVRISFQPQRRGWQPVPVLRIETRFPLGVFRAWSVWRPAQRVLVYPKPERHPPPLPAPVAVTSGEAAARVRDGGEVEGVRAYRRGDPLKLIVWKKAAKTSELVSRDTVALRAHELWLDHGACAPLDAERRLSRLCAWVLDADRRDLRYGLRLPGANVSPGEGEAQRRRALEALALSGMGAGA